MVCLYLSKISMMLFIRKVFSGNMHHEKSIFRVAFAVCIIGCIASTLAISISCRPLQMLVAKENAVCSANVFQSSPLITRHMLTSLVDSSLGDCMHPRHRQRGSTYLGPCISGLQDADAKLPEADDLRNLLTSRWVSETDY